MSRNVLYSIVAAVVGITLTSIGCTAVVQHNGTVRETTCVEAGGSYVLTASGSGRECRQ